MLKASDKAEYYKGKLSPKIIKTAIQKGFRYYYDSVFNLGRLDDQMLLDYEYLIRHLQSNTIACKTFYLPLNN